MSLSPVVKGVLDNVLGSPLVARDRYSGGGFMDEIPRWENPWTGKFEPIPGRKPDAGWGHHPMPPAPAPGWGHHPGVKTMEWNYERDGQNPLAGFGPIGAYNPDTDESKVVPLDFLNNFLDERLLAKGKSPFSTPYWDKQDDIRKYLDNDRRLIDSLIRRGKIKV